MNSAVLALDLGMLTGWALRTADGNTVSSTQSFRPGRFEGGGMRYLRFRRWLTELKGPRKALARSTSKRCADMPESTLRTPTGASWPP